MSDDRRWALIYGAALTVAVGALAGVLAQMTVFVPLHRGASTIEARVGATLVTVLGVAVAVTALAAVTVVPLYGTLSGRVRNADVPWLLGLSLGVVVCVAVGFVGVQPYAGGFAEAHTEKVGPHGGADADFDVTIDRVEDERAVVTLTYVDGPPLAAEHVHLKADDFADVPGVDHQGPGPWRGTVSGDRNRLGGPSIVTGDEVTVGVTDDCAVGLFYEIGGTDSVIAAYSCPET